MRFRLFSLRLLLVSPLLLLLLAYPGCTKEGKGIVPPSSLPYPFTPGKGSRAYRAGVATGPLFSPWGLSMGGFGFRVGPLTGRNEHLGSALGWYQTLMVKALAIGNDGGLVIFTKLPLIFPSDLLRRQVLARLAKRTGYDFSPSLILTATHTHSAPARFWALPRGAGIFGMDEYDPAVVAGLSESIAEVVEAAWRSMRPASVGVTEVLRFDPENRINGDRRPEDDNLYTDLEDPNVYLENGVYKTKDHRLVLIKVVDQEGKPMAAAVRFGIHGTIFAEEAYTEDAPGGIEIACEEALGVPVLFLQGAAGDVSPRGDDRGRGGTQQMEAVGRYTAQVVTRVWEGIPLESEGEIRLQHQWLKLSRERLGYKANEFGVRVGSFFQPYAYGAFQCGNFGPSVPPDEGKPETRLEDGALGCLDIVQFEGIFAPSPREYELPIGELSRAVQAAIQLGSWYFVTFPGEPVSPLESLMIREARARGFERVVVLGYSQNHLFYLTPEEDWFQGGYEAAMNIWGWRLGEFLVAQNLKLLERLREQPYPSFSGDPPEPLKREQEERTPAIASLPHPPRWLSLSSSTLPYLGQIEGSWIGGDSWLAPPWVKLVRAGDGKVVRSSSGFGFLITAEEGSAGTLYAIRFEAGLDLPRDRYRFEASGRYRTPEGAVLPYTVTSPEFTITGGAILEVTGTASGNVLKLYPRIVSHPVEVLEVARDLMNRYQVGGFRLVSLGSGPREPTPLTGTTISVRATLLPVSESVENPALPYDPACSCYPLTLPRSYPGEVTAVLLTPPLGLTWEGNTLIREFRIP